MIRVLPMLLNDVSDRGVGFDGVPVEECSGYFGFAGLIPVGHDGEPFVKVVGDVNVDASAGHLNGLLDSQTKPSTAIRLRAV